MDPFDNEVRIKVVKSDADGRWHIEWRASLMVVAVLLLFLFAVGKRVSKMLKHSADQKAGYEGTIVAKGLDVGAFSTVSPDDYYLMVRDAAGITTKRYVGLVVYASCSEGERIIKKEGRGEMPKVPGKLTLAEMIAMAAEYEKKQASQK